MSHANKNKQSFVRVCLDSEEKKDLCHCLKLLHVSVLLTLIYFDFQERNEHRHSLGVRCLPLGVVNTKGCPPQLIVQKWEINNGWHQSR